MSYQTITQATHDQALVGRVTAAVADEAWSNQANYASQFSMMARTQPDAAALQLVWPVASADDVEAAYASALAAGNPNPGGDEAVVTDQMILSHVQAAWPTG